MNRILIKIYIEYNLILENENEFLRYQVVQLCFQIIYQTINFHITIIIIL